VCVCACVQLPSFKTLNINQNVQYPEEDSSLVGCSRHFDSQGLCGLLDLEDAGTVLLKFGKWLLRHGVTTKKTSIFMINTALRTYNLTLEHFVIITNPLKSTVYCTYHPLEHEETFHFVHMVYLVCPMILQIDSESFPVHFYTTGVCNGSTLCSLRGMKGAFTYRTELFEMIVGVLPTSHTQYTWDRSTCISYLLEQHFKFLLHTLKVLYICTLCDSTNIYTHLKCIVYDKLLKPRQSFRITL